MLAEPRHFAFQTGGPFVTRVMPSYGDIEGNQAFVLRLNASNDGASALAEDKDSEQQVDTSTKLIADKQRVMLDRDGAGKLSIKPLPAVESPKRPRSKPPSPIRT